GGKRRHGAPGSPARRRGARNGEARGRAGAGLAAAAGARPHPLRPGRRRRHGGAHPVRQVGRDPGRHLRHREPGRRRGHHRRGRGGPGGAGRPHPVARRDGALGQSRAVRAPALRHGARVPPGVPRGPGAEPAPGPPGRAGAERGGRGRAGAGGAGRARRGLIGQRHGAAHGAGDVRAR
ncbi:MAG: hypothetical protein AVDCRST_MAG04-1225, partial [uncultured Acetobacteraceae bacterium]